MKRTITLILIAALAIGTIFAAGQEEAKKTDAVKIALIVENTVDDKGWCQAMHDGIMAAMQELPGRIEYAKVENTKPVDAGSAVRQYANLGYDLIICHGAQYKNTIIDAAAEFPDISFAFGTSSDIVGNNVFTYMPESEETGYLSGLIAGMTTKTNIVGLIGPVDGGDAARYNRGFVLGVQKVNPACKILVGHIGSFSDTVESGEFAHSNIESGAEVLTGSSQQALGALRAVADYKDKDIWWVGQDLAQLNIAEGYKCIAASSYNYKAVIIGLIEKLDAGIKGGACIPMNFNNGGFVFGFNDAQRADKITPEIRTAVENELKNMTATAGLHADYKAVDYSKL